MSAVRALKDKIRKRMSGKRLASPLEMFFFGRPEGFFGSDMEKAVSMHAERHKPQNVGELVERFVSDRDNLCQDFSCRDMARKICLPCRTLQDYFQNDLMMDFRTWKAKVKIEAAKDLLLEYPDSPVCEIASTLGFSDRSNFHHRFKSLTGCTPSEWRDKGLAK